MKEVKRTAKFTIKFSVDFYVSGNTKKEQLKTEKAYRKQIKQYVRNRLGGQYIALLESNGSFDEACTKETTVKVK